MMRTIVAGTLWPNASEPHAHGNLRTTLWRIGRTAAGLVDTSREFLGLNGTVEVDIDRLRSSAAAAGDGRCGSGDALALMCGELLPGWYDDWVLFERERLRHTRLHALERLTVHHRDSARYDEAIDCALHAIQLEPLRESPHRLLMSIHLAEGNYSEAVRHFDSFRLLLERELGVEPSPRIRAMLPARIARVTPG